jgi:hypothetical protein
VSDWTIFPALHEEIGEGWVWATLPKESRAPHVAIENLRTGKRIVCELRIIENHFRSTYKDHTGVTLPEDRDVLVVNGYYREKLALPDRPREIANLEIVPARGVIASLRSGTMHPNSAVRTATWLGVLSAALGVLSLGVALSAFLR